MNNFIKWLFFISFRVEDMFLASVLTQQKNCKKQRKKFKAYKRYLMIAIVDVYYIFSFFLMQLVPTLRAYQKRGLSCKRTSVCALEVLMYIISLLHYWSQCTIPLHVIWRVVLRGMLQNNWWSLLYQFYQLKIHWQQLFFCCMLGKTVWLLDHMWVAVSSADKLKCCSENLIQLIDVFDSASHSN